MKTYDPEHDYSDNDPDCGDTYDSNFPSEETGVETPFQPTETDKTLN
jgi:hypothetical protein